MGFISSKKFPTECSSILPLIWAHSGDPVRDMLILGFYDTFLSKLRVLGQFDGTLNIFVYAFFDS
eukprot:snap_masked-scaffold_6-processed-gene-9.2-mRNA-1 protein AED:1.00 eAED:1.00 QI:0/0/0/0/1/1/2/0/64